MLFVDSAERLRSIEPEEGREMPIYQEQEEFSGVRKKLDDGTDAEGVKDDQAGNSAYFNELVYYGEVDELRRKNAGATPEEWEAMRVASDREVARGMHKRRQEQRTYAEKIKALTQKDKELRAQYEVKDAARRAYLAQKQVGRFEQRELAWANENRRDFESTQALDIEYAEWLKHSGYEGMGDIEELNVVQTHIKHGDQTGLRLARRSEDLAYDEEGIPHSLATGNALSADGMKSGLRTLLSEEYLPAFEAFLRKKYALDFAGLARVCAQVEDLDRKALGGKTDLGDRSAINKKVEELVEHFFEQLVTRFTEGETDGHLGKEAGSRQRFQWLQNRLLGVLRATGVVTRIDFSAGALVLGEDGGDLSYAEIDSEEAASDEKKAIVFSRLAMRNPEDWGKEFRPGSKEVHKFSEHVQNSMAELALLSVLMQDVGGDVSAYDIDVERGRFIQKTTGEVFSVAADFTGALPKDLTQRMQKIPALKANIEESLACRSIPFEIACLHRLPVSASMRKALASLAEQLQDDAHPLTSLVRRSFAATFLNPLLAGKEYTLFTQRIAECAKQDMFDADKPGIIRDFYASTQPLVGSAALLGRVPMQEVLTDAA